MILSSHIYYFTHTHAHTATWKDMAEKKLYLPMFIPFHLVIIIIIIIIIIIVIVIIIIVIIIIILLLLLLLLFIYFFFCLRSYAFWFIGFFRNSSSY